MNPPRAILHDVTYRNPYLFWAWSIQDPVAYRKFLRKILIVKARLEQADLDNGGGMGEGVRAC